jgi:hypothetical protein
MAEGGTAEAAKEAMKYTYIGVFMLKSALKLSLVKRRTKTHKDTDNLSRRWRTINTKI